MKVFFGTLKVLISQLLYDIGIYFYDRFIMLWENLHEILRRLIIVVSIIVTLLFDAWIFWMLYNWVEHPVIIVFSGVGGALLVMMQIIAWIDRKKIYKWFLNRWSRASQTYRHKRATAQVVKMHDEHISAVGKALDACRDSVDLDTTINDRIYY